MSEANRKRPFLPPRWFVRAAWVIHRAIYRFTGGRMGLWEAKPRKWGTMRLTTVGRRSGMERNAILGYYEDGPNLITLAMNGWAKPEPAWWLNLQARPDATVVLADGERKVCGRAATGAERNRLWARWGEFGDDYEAYARLRPSETAVVVLEPRSAEPSRRSTRTRQIPKPRTTRPQKGQGPARRRGPRARPVPPPSSVR